MGHASQPNLGIAWFPSKARIAGIATLRKLLRRRSYFPSDRPGWLLAIAAAFRLVSVPSTGHYAAGLSVHDANNCVS